MLTRVCSDNTLRIWGTESGECHAVLEGHQSRVWDVSTTKLGDFVASASGDGTVKVRRRDLYNRTNIHVYHYVKDMELEELFAIMRNNLKWPWRRCLFWALSSKRGKSTYCSVVCRSIPL